MSIISDERGMSGGDLFVPCPAILAPYPIDLATMGRFRTAAWFQ